MAKENHKIKKRAREKILLLSHRMKKVRTLLQFKNRTH